MVLPVNLDSIFTLDCEIFSRLAVILTRRENDVWYKERFMDCVLIENFEFSVTGLERYFDFSYYDEVLDTEVLSSWDSNIENIPSVILGGKYVRALIDRYYLPGADDYMRNHIMHDVILHGYDEKNKEFNFFEHSINYMPWAKGKIHKTELQKALYSGINSILDNSSYMDRELYYNPIYTYTVKTTMRTKPSLERLYYDLKCWKEGKRSYVEILDCGNKKTKECIYGIPIYKKIYDDIAKECLSGNFNYLNEFVYYFKNFVCVKDFMVDKLVYYNEKTKMDFPEAYINMVKNISVDVKKIFALFTRYLITKEEKVMIAIIELLKSVEQFDYEVSSKIMEHISSQNIKFVKACGD